VGSTVSSAGEGSSYAPISAFGTLETCPPVLRMSVHRGRPEVAVVRQTRRRCVIVFGKRFRKRAISLIALPADGQRQSRLRAVPPGAPFSAV
jgi:flavin reductase (DIM6/NTAB) family NADH-FMN oxidoreductase RutF